MSDNKMLPFEFPAISRKRVIATFDGGRLTSDGGVVLLAAADRRIGVAARLATLISDRRDPLRVTHSVADILRARMLAIVCAKMPTISIVFAQTPASSLPAAACRTVVPICVRSQWCRAGKTHRACAKSCT